MISAFLPTVPLAPTALYLSPLRLSCRVRSIRSIAPSRHVATMSVPPTSTGNIITNNVYDHMTDLIGNTPLVKLQRASRETGCDIYGKCEFMNPSSSVKARAALYLILDAERRGLLTPGKPGIIVESTAGNTGISLAEIASARGYKCVIVIPKTQSQEKKDALRYAGAELVQVPAKPYTNPNNYVKFGARLAKELGAVYTNQFDNPANRSAHVATTGPEIWAQLKGKVDGFSCAIGTGGTVAGVAEYLRSVSDTVKIAVTDPCGAKLVRFYNDGILKAQGDSITEGIGQGRVTGNLEGFTPDYAFEIPDEEVSRSHACFHPLYSIHYLETDRFQLYHISFSGNSLGPGRCVQSHGGRRIMFGNVLWYQYRRCNATGPRARSGSHIGDGAVRPGYAIQWQDVQSTVSRGKGFTQAGMARCQFVSRGSGCHRTHHHSGRRGQSRTGAQCGCSSCVSGWSYLKTQMQIKVEHSVCVMVIHGNV